MDENKILTSSKLIIDKEEITKNKPIGSGNWGHVYRYDNDKIIKITDKYGSSEQYEMVSFIKNLNLPNFYKIYDVLYHETVNVKEFSGTISKYYPEEKIDLFTTTSDYLLDSFNSLTEALKILSENKIIAYDFCCKNILLTNEGIIGIDVDFYQKMDEYSKSRIMRINMKQLKEAIMHRLLVFNLDKYHRDDFDIQVIDKLNKALYNLINLDSITDTKQFNKILSKYKYPIDYLRKKTK